MTDQFEWVRVNHPQAASPSVPVVVYSAGSQLYCIQERAANSVEVLCSKLQMLQVFDVASCHMSPVQLCFAHPGLINLLFTWGS